MTVGVRGRIATRVAGRGIGTRALLLAALPVAAFFLSMYVGRYPLPPQTVIKAFAAKVPGLPTSVDSIASLIVFQIRLPRVLLAMAVGAALATSGAAFQGMFQNPLASPDILGVSAGAGFGAVLAIFFGANLLTIQLAAFVFGLCAVALTYAIARAYAPAPILVLLLIGIVVGSIFAALISLLTYLADPQRKLPTIVFWLMGSLERSSTSQLASALPPMAIGIAILLLVRWRLNVLSLGDDEARSLGVSPQQLRLVVCLAATVATASAVSISGIVGWVGLVIPHAARLVVGPNHALVLPASVALGSAYLLIVDDVARSATPGEIPLGILTALVGAPVFALLMRRMATSWS